MADINKNIYHLFYYPEHVNSSYDTSTSRLSKNSESKTKSSSISNSKRTAIKLTIDNRQQMIQQLKLNHALLLDGSSIRSSEQAAFISDLDLSLYKEEPIIYTNINDPEGPTNLLSFTNINDNLKLSDVCINFPIVKI